MCVPNILAIVVCIKGPTVCLLILVHAIRILVTDSGNFNLEKCSCKWQYVGPAPLSRLT